MQKITLQDKQYSKTKALELVKSILNKGEVGRFLEREELQILMDVLEYHPKKDQKIGCGVQGIQILQEEFFRYHRRFDILRSDGSREDFSYYKAIRDGNWEFVDMMKAFRYAVIDQTKKFKDDAYGSRKYVRCAITGLNMQKKDAHTDHKPPLTFDQLVFDFLKERSLCVKDVAIEHTANVACRNLADEALRRDWQTYHAEYAQLQVVLDHANWGQSKTKVPWEELKSTVQENS